MNITIKLMSITLLMFIIGFLQENPVEARTIHLSEYSNSESNFIWNKFRIVDSLIKELTESKRVILTSDRSGGILNRVIKFIFRDIIWGIISWVFGIIWWIISGVLGVIWSILTSWWFWVGLVVLIVLIVNSAKK